MNHPFTPPYVQAELIDGADPAHSWDEWDPYPLLGERDAQTEHEILQLSDRARIAFAIGCAEWTLARFRRRLDPTLAAGFIQACWACEMSDDFVLPDPPDEELWQGPLLGPIHLALLTVLNTFIGMEEENSEIDASFAELIPLHVLNDAAPFLAWRRSALARLHQIAPRLDRDVKGPPIPPAALDPALAPTTPDLERLVHDFLSQPALADNPFLRRL